MFEFCHLFMRQVALFYHGVSDQLSIDVESPWHHSSLLSSYPLLNNTLLLLIFCVLHR